jgi:hypothetical protein
VRINLGVGIPPPIFASRCQAGSKERHRPQLVRDACGHRWREFVRLVQLHKVVPYEIERQRVTVIVPRALPGP